MNRKNLKFIIEKFWSLKGKKLSEQNANINQAGDYQQEIDFSHHRSGIYFVKIASADAIGIRKLVVW